jgi:phosphoserine phosphatase
VAAFSFYLAKRKCNIERIKMISRGGLGAMEMEVDLREVASESLRSDMIKVARDIGVDLVVQSAQAYQRRKKVIAFDMDSTIVDTEIIDELAKLAGVGGQVAAITERGMQGRMDYIESLRERVALLKGLSVKALEAFARTIRLTRGSEELVSALKEMGFKLALITGGFTFFTERIKKKLGFDYAFGNELEIKNGKLTGRLKGRIIDAEGKAWILDEICRLEGITRDEVVAVGDGANDRIMVANAGLGIAFNAKDVLKQVADGAITKDHMKGILYCLGISEADLGKS